ncbi:MAG: zf-HC2 domain-containing protein [Pseudomonadales bacterium]|nr:zf-HC2 domain-containing protein [Pseudomonadales bacterium]
MGKNPMHAEVQELLPWLINETLGDRERKKVLKHLRACRQCREERDHLQRLEQEILSAGEAELPDYRFPYRKLMARIDAEEKREEMPETSRGGFPSRSWFSMIGAAATLVLGVLFVASSQPPSIKTQDG